MATSLWESVGNTPLLKINSLSEMTGCEIFAKAEFLNPAGSVKDRAAKSIIRAAESEGRLKPGYTIYEGTAGNTGIALATLAVERGYRAVIVMPDNQASEKFDFLKALGVKVVAVKPCPFADPNHFYHTARRLAEDDPQGIWANQFENTANSQTHFETTGPEIWKQVDGRIDAFLSAVGTGGTMAGVSRYLKECAPTVRTVLVDPMGSGLYNYVRTGEMKSEGTSVTEGIGIMRVTANFKEATIDEAMQVNDQEMIEMFTHVARHDGLVVGTSAALNLRATYDYARARRGSGKRLVTILCDHGSRYQSRLLNDEWLASKGLFRDRALPTN